MHILNWKEDDEQVRQIHTLRYANCILRPCEDFPNHFRDTIMPIDAPLKTVPPLSGGWQGQGVVA